MSQTTRSIGLVILVALACGPGSERAGSREFASDVSTVQVVSTNVQGKNVYIPSTIVVTSGKPVKLSIFNTTDIPHGFAIDGIGVEKILPPGEELEVALPELEGGNVHHIRCHLHPAHRTGTLVVLPGKD